MTPFKTALFSLAVLLAPELHAQPQPLPRPLTLPPGLVQTLPVHKAASYLGDAVKIQDCPEDRDNPLGLCNNVLFGGLAMYLSPLSGDLEFRFYPPEGNFAKFEIRHPGGLRGDDAVMRAPQFYRFAVKDVVVAGGAAAASGEVDLTTGEVRNLEYRFRPGSTFLDALRRLNPKLDASELTFPGPYGTAIARFDQRPDGLLDFTFFGSAFLPLGNNMDGDKVRIPLPFCPAPGVCRGMEAPGSSLHPRLRITTRVPVDPECGPACPEIPLNSSRVYTASTYYTSLGDRFHLDIPELGGDAVGRSHLQGRLHFQFGGRYGDLVPVAVSALLPDGLLAQPPPSPLPGFAPNLAGHDEMLRFPNYTYQPKGVALADDPFDFAMGAVDLRTGRFVGGLVYRGLPAQDLLFTILERNAGRIPTDTFRWRGPASFERGVNGSTIFRFNADVFLRFATFQFPTPDYSPDSGWPAGDNGELNPFLKFQASSPGDSTVAMKSGQIDERSSFGDQVSFRYSIPCDTANKSFSFEFTNPANAARGGTFRMTALAAVSCTSARGSSAGPGDADIVTFSGFGTWSQDDGLHLATVQVSTAPGARYWSVQIDGGLLSNANAKPPEETEP